MRKGWGTESFPGGKCFTGGEVFGGDSPSPGSRRPGVPRMPRPCGSGGAGVWCGLCSSVRPEFRSFSGAGEVRSSSAADHARLKKECSSILLDEDGEHGNDEQRHERAGDDGGRGVVGGHLVGVAHGVGEGAYGHGGEQHAHGAPHGFGVEGGERGVGDDGLHQLLAYENDELPARMKHAVVAVIAQSCADDDAERHQRAGHDRIAEGAAGRFYDRRHGGAGKIEHGSRHRGEHHRIGDERERNGAYGMPTPGAGVHQNEQGDEHHGDFENVGEGACEHHHGTAGIQRHEHGQAHEHHVGEARQH